MRAILPVLLLLAACGGKPSKEAQGRPEDVAKAVFDAFKAGGIGPLEPHLMTADEQRKVTGIVLDDSEERERWERRIAQIHERLDVDWTTAKLSATNVRIDAMGGRATVGVEITSERGPVALDVSVTKVGRRYVFQDVKIAKGAAMKEAAPAEEEDACGED